jgi:hypothetical protein
MKSGAYVWVDSRLLHDSWPKNGAILVALQETFRTGWDCHCAIESLVAHHAVTERPCLLQNAEPARDQILLKAKNELQSFSFASPFPSLSSFSSFL